MAFVEFSEMLMGKVCTKKQNRTKNSSLFVITGSGWDVAQWWSWRAQTSILGSILSMTNKTKTNGIHTSDMDSEVKLDLCCIK